jgi:hypothetical protein
MVMGGLELCREGSSRPRVQERWLNELTYSRVSNSDVIETAPRTPGCVKHQADAPHTVKHLLDLRCQVSAVLLQSAVLGNCKHYVCAGLPQSLAMSSGNRPQLCGMMPFAGKAIIPG